MIAFANLTSYFGFLSPEMSGGFLIGCGLTLFYKNIINKEKAQEK